MILVPFDKTYALIQRFFESYGFSATDSTAITTALLAADLAGIESHGIQRMIRYHKAIQDGMVDPKAIPETVWETPISAVIDAKKAMGQIVSMQAMQLAIEKAKLHGIGMVTVRNSNHFGIAGYYARMAAAEGCIGAAMTNSEAIMVPTNSRKAMLGTNPIAVAFPADPTPFCFDAATTVVPLGKLEVYRKAKKVLPGQWAVDEEGQPCYDPDQMIHNISGRVGGGILPLGGNSELTGGHKGYGYGMLCELFTAILSGGATSYQSYTQPALADTAHAFWAIDYRLFGDPEQIRASCSAFLEDIRHAPPVREGQRVYIHGEKELESADKIYRNGIPANEKTVTELQQIAREQNVPFAL